MRLRRAAVGLVITGIIALGAVAAANSQNPPEAQVESERHINEIMRSLAADSLLRQQLMNGAHGDGVRYGWMDDMRQDGIRKVVVWVGINFGRRGRAKEM